MKIVLENMEFRAFHGCYESERVVGGDYLVTVELEFDGTQACQTDNVADTVNYEQIYQIVKHEMQQPSNLIEHVAGRIKTALQAEFRQAKFTIELSKLAPPLGGKVGAAKVVI